MPTLAQIAFLNYLNTHSHPSIHKTSFMQRNSIFIVTSFFTNSQFHTFLQAFDPKGTAMNA